MKQIFFFTFFVLCSHFTWAQYGSISGKVTDAETYETLPFVTVAISEDIVRARDKGLLLIGGHADLDGYFKIDSIPVGTYEVLFSFVGMADHLEKEVVVEENSIQTIDVALKESRIIICHGPVFIAYKVPLMPRNRDIPGSGIEVHFGRNRNRPNIGISSYTK